MKQGSTTQPVLPASSMGPSENAAVRPRKGTAARFPPPPPSTATPSTCPPRRQENASLSPPKTLTWVTGSVCSCSQRSSRVRRTSAPRASGSFSLSAVAGAESCHMR